MTGSAECDEIIKCVGVDWILEGPNRSDVVYLERLWSIFSAYTTSSTGIIVALKRAPPCCNPAGRVVL